MPSRPVVFARAPILAAALAAAAPGLSAQEEAPAAPAVSPGWSDGDWLDANAGVELTVSPEPPPGSRIAVFIGATDVTALFARAPGKLSYRPGPMRLPSGESELVAHLVTAEGQWQEIGRHPIRIRTRGGWEQATVDPRLELGGEAQVAEDHAPAANRPPRETFQDLTSTGGITTAHARNGWVVRSQANVVGVSHREKALRFSQDGVRAPRVDLSDYRVDVERGPVRAALGHVSWEGNRHLVGQFASRGATANVRLSSRVDLTAAWLHGSSIVGWDNFFGIDRREHRLGGATLGLEAFPASPGVLRVEATGLTGSLLPVAGFTQGVVNDTEKSRGWGVRLVTATPDQRGRLEAGFSRSRFDNPTDPLLAQGATLVPVRETTRSARYLEASFDVVRAWAITPSVQGRLTAAYRHERTDPLYRSIAANLQADRSSHAVELQGGVGEATLQVLRTLSRDNLDDVPSVLVTRGRDWALTAAAPLAFLAGSSSRPAWLPSLSYRFQRTHQRGDGVPPGSGARPTFVPDQVSLVHGVGVDWQGLRWRASYRLERSTQDNRQAERERADNATVVHGVALELTPLAPVTVALDLSLERAENKEIARRDRTLRGGLTVEWRATSATTLGVRWSETDARDDARVRESDAGDLTLQVAQRLDVFQVSGWPLPGQVFVRFGRQTSRAVDREFQVDESRSNWTATTGLTLTLF
ncbi:MAG TPA: hypothetical protein VG500_11545 [Gemmatimonadales bacterium]|nr:hypothetical protein [Gemmatimonadales bacterium]